jgi:VanZ like family
MAIKAAILCVALGLFGLVVWRILVRRTGWGSPSALLMCLAAAVCLALTVPQAIAPGAAARLGTCLADPAGGLAYSVRIFGTRGLEDAMNVLLWVPPGLFGTLATRRPGYVAGVISAAMVIIELLQTLDPWRECDPGDWAYNTAGGLAGAVIGWLLLRGYTRLRSRRTRTSQA